MSDRKGDPAKQPPECTPVFTPFPGETNRGTWSQCPNLKETGGGFEGERYRCEVCGESFFLDYDEMR